MLCKNIYSCLWIILCTSIDSLLYSRGSLMMLHLLVVTSPHKCWLSHFCTKMCHRGRTAICSWQKAQTKQNLHPMLNPFPDDQFHLSLRKFFINTPWKLTKHIFSQHVHPNSVALLLVILSRILSNYIVWSSFPLYMPCPISPGIYLHSHSNNLHWLFCYQWVSVACTRSNCIMCYLSSIDYSAICGFLLYTLYTIFVHSSICTGYSAIRRFSVACTLSNCIVCSSTPLKIYYSAVCGFLLYTF